ncbi:hypothetical protein N7466_011220 [Penicillium verhagenii]|uniref:uncharacterized protein n=1 Tax=Penicillium verhagenii TaxID=1562060 RepID=UPI00254533E8|nr:uncharacterized protein N7466_011220 [Penicillium verhagenii]KAJ5917666.1 hypothetical protein N7466_011220 [Penicillium verhagenii]
MDRRYNVERSCLRCHERKVRCDKGTPCNKCSRLNVPCEYPGPKRVKRRAPKTTSTDLVERLEQLERSITSIAGQSAQPTPQHPTGHLLSDYHTHTHTANHDVVRASSSESSAVTSGRQTARAEPGFLAKNGSYVDEPFLSRVLEKEHELQSAMGSPNTENGAARKPPRIKVDGMITNPQLIPLDIKSLHPSRWQATVLWETFLSRVDPVVKVIHVPTTKPRIFAAINRPDSVQPDVHCLLFAIFFGAATAMSSDNPENDGIRSDMRRYQQGIELAMYQSSFLDSPTVTSLQALAIFLTCLRYSNSGRSGFTLRGLAIRAAQSIGLHRDGKHFKLSPLECEIRRRLWWMLATTDCRMAEDHGITVTEHGGDAQLPANIDDLSLSETATEPISSQAQWTEMTFSLIISEVNRMWLPMARSTIDSEDGARPEQLIAKFHNALQEKYVQYGDLDIPIQRMGILLSQILVAKAEVHLRQKGLQTALPSSSAGDSEETQELLGMACRALNLGLQMYSDELLRGFRWLTSTYTQFHLLTYILWHLCVFPTGQFVEEAWRGVETHFELVARDPSWPDPGPKWPMLVQLRAKALRIRNAHSASVAQREQQRQEEQQQMQSTEIPVSVDDAALQNLGAPFWDLDDLDFNWSEFPDWNYLAQSIGLMNPDGMIQ